MLSSEEVIALLGQENEFISNKPNTVDLLIRYLRKEVEAKVQRKHQLAQTKSFSVYPSIQEYQDYCNQAIHALREELALSQRNIEHLRKIVRKELEQKEEVPPTPSRIGETLKTRHIDLVKELATQEGKSAAALYRPLTIALGQLIDDHSKLFKGVMCIKEMEQNLYTAHYPPIILAELEPLWAIPSVETHINLEAKDLAEKIYRKEVDLTVALHTTKTTKAAVRDIADSQKVLTYMQMVRGYLYQFGKIQAELDAPVSK